MKTQLDPAIRRANIRLASVLGLIAFGFYALFLYVGMA